MKIATNKTLRAVIDILESMAANGATERGQARAIVRAIRKLRRADQTRDQRAMSEAVDQIARLVLRQFD